MGTEIRQSPIEGLGVFATRAFEAGEPVFSFREAPLRLWRRLELLWNPGLQGSRSLLQAAPDGFLVLPPERDANHSCNPNTGIDGDLDLVALRGIRAGQEILWDYSTTMDLDNWSMSGCQCQSPECRGAIGPFKNLPPGIALRYIGLGIVPDYCARHFGLPGWDSSKAMKKPR